MALVHYCLACREEFRPDIERCSDCGGPLVPHDDTAPPPHDEGDADGPEALEGELATVVRVDRALHLDPLIERLAGNHVLARVDRHGNEFSLVVAAAELGSVRELLADLLPAVPDLQGHVPDGPPEGFDPEAGAYTRCPACDEPLRGHAECPACGLALGAPEEEGGER